MPSGSLNPASPRARSLSTGSPKWTLSSLSKSPRNNREAVEPLARDKISMMKEIIAPLEEMLGQAAEKVVTNVSISKRGPMLILALSRSVTASIMVTGRWWNPSQRSLPRVTLSLCGNAPIAVTSFKKVITRALTMRPLISIRKSKIKMMNLLFIIGTTRNMLILNQRERSLIHLYMWVYRPSLTTTWKQVKFLKSAQRKLIFLSFSANFQPRNLLICWRKSSRVFLLNLVQPKHKLNITIKIIAECTLTHFWKMKQRETFRGSDSYLIKVIQIKTRRLIAVKLTWRCSTSWTWT